MATCAYMHISVIIAELLRKVCAHNSRCPFLHDSCSCIYKKADNVRHLLRHALLCELHLGHPDSSIAHMFWYCTCTSSNSRTGMHVHLGRYMTCTQAGTEEYTTPRKPYMYIHIDICVDNTVYEKQHLDIHIYVYNLSVHESYIYIHRYIIDILQDTYITIIPSVYIHIYIYLPLAQSEATYCIHIYVYLYT